MLNILNVQQLPKKGEGAKVRSMIRAHRPDAVVVSLDFNAQEIRISAMFSRDPGLVACYVGDNKKDFHGITGAEMMETFLGRQGLDQLSEKYGISTSTHEGRYNLFMKVLKDGNAEEVKQISDIRKSAKTVNFASSFGTTAPTLAKTLLVSVDEAQRYLDAKYSAFPRYEDWKLEEEAKVKELGYVSLRDGTRRHLASQVQSENKWEVEKAMRQSTNVYMQGTAAQQTKTVMASIWKSGVLFDADVQFYFPVHDEVVFSVTRDKAIDTIKVVHQCMTALFYGEIPVQSSIALGPNFADQIECGDEFDAQAIERAIEQVFSEELEAA